MSDEQTPPPPALRLKPRLRPEAGEATPSPAPVAESSAEVAVPPPVGETPRTEPPVAVIPPEAPAPAGSGESVKFKLKPKLSQPVEVAAPTPAVVPAEIPVVIPAVILPETVPAVSTADAPPTKSPPPFPLIAPAGSGKSVPPPVASATTPTAPSGVAGVPAAVPETEEAPRGGARRSLTLVAVVVVLGAGGFFGWRQFQAKPAAPAKPVVAAPPAAPATAAPAKAPVAEKAPAAAPTSSDTLNQLAHAPVNAINKAQDAIAARRASGQSRVDDIAAGSDVPDRPAPKVSAPAPKAESTTAVATGVAATVPIEAGAEASAAFRLYVTKVKVSGVFQGNPPRAMINGRLTRAGERIDAELGVIFEGLDADRHQLIFTDGSGAKVYRKY